MGCCESRDNRKKAISTDFSHSQNLHREIKSLSIKKLTHYPDLLLTLTRIEKSIQKDPSVLLFEDSHLKLESIQSVNSTQDIPTFKLSFYFSSYISLEKILNSIIKSENRKEWDLNLLSIEEKNNLLHSTFQYSIYQIEFFEEFFLFSYEEKAGILLRSSTDGFEKSEKFVRPKNFYTFYSVKENSGNSILEVFLKIDPKTYLAIIVAEVVKEKILGWGENFFKYLNS